MARSCKWRSKQLLAIMPEKGIFRAKDLSLPPGYIDISPTGIGRYLAAMESRGLLKRAGREWIPKIGYIIEWTLTDLGREIKGGV